MVKDDLVGKKIGKLLVLRRIGPSNHNKYNNSFYRCKCECKKIVIKSYYYLINAHNAAVERSCGCAMIGKTFGKLTIISKASKNKYKCQCECKKTIIKPYHYLFRKTDMEKSCGCVKRISPHLKDLAGKTFGWLKVIRRGPNTKQGKSTWECRCKCKKIVTKTLDYLKFKNKRQIQSCGCAPFRNLTGKTFNNLTVLSMSHKKGACKHSSLCRCKCKCGKEKDINTINILSGQKSCTYGCCIDKKVAAQKDSYSQYKGSAKYRKRKFKITLKEFILICEQECLYCGKPACETISATERKKAWPHNGIDRILSSGGYIPGNCASCCTDCNELKWDSMLDDFYKKAEQIVHHRVEKSCGCALVSSIKSCGCSRYPTLELALNSTREL
jgi:hypothetical protein